MLREYYTTKPQARLFDRQWKKLLIEAEPTLCVDTVGLGPTRPAWTRLQWVRRFGKGIPTELVAFGLLAVPRVARDSRNPGLDMDGMDIVDTLDGGIVTPKNIPLTVWLVRMNGLPGYPLSPCSDVPCWV